MSSDTLKTAIFKSIEFLEGQTQNPGIIGEEPPFVFFGPGVVIAIGTFDDPNALIPMIRKMQEQMATALVNIEQAIEREQKDNPLDGPSMQITPSGVRPKQQDDMSWLP